MKRFFRVLLCASFVVAAGCEPAAVAPDLQSADSGASVAAKEGGFAVYEYQVRPAEGSLSTAYGVLQVWVGVPPNPIYPDPGPPDEPVVVLRGVLHNGGGEALQRTDLVFDPDGTPNPVLVEFDQDAGACGTTFFRALAVPPNPIYPEPGPPTYPDPGPPQVMLVTSAGALAAYLNPGPPTILATEGGVPPLVNPGEPPPPAYPEPGPPDAPGACTVTGIAG